MHIDTFEDYDEFTQFPGLKRRDKHNGLVTGKKQSPRTDHLSDWLTSQQEGEGSSFPSAMAPATTNGCCWRMR